MLDFLHHLFVPRESNNHRARILHGQPLLLLVVLLLIINFLTPKVSRQYPSVLGVTANIAIDDLVRLTNQQRVQAGLSPLTLNSHLSQAASLKAHYMFEKNFWAHNAPDGTTPWVFIKSAGYEYVYAGENLARGFTTATDAMSAWMASPGHRENILSPNYNDIGFAVATGSLTGEDTVLIVEMFGSQAKGSPSVVSGAQNVAPTPTIVIQPTVIAQVPITRTPKVSVAPTEAVLPTVALLQTNSITITPNGTYYVAGLTRKPLIDTEISARILALVIAGLFIFLFVLDMIVIERRQVVRLVSHNLDHILYLTVIFTIILFLQRGGIL